MRFGMHSGPVTAGVLRGDRARFQLFGDTVNTASRIESTGQRNRIHLSEQTAAELTAHGKQDWIVPRQDMIEAKGKGKLVTYWLKQSSELKATGGMSLTTASTSWRDSEDSETCSIAEDSIHLDSKSVSTEKRDDAHARLDSHDQKTSLSDDRTCCLVDWNCELLVQLLNRVVARRKATNAIGPTLTEDLDLIVHTIGRTSIVVDEVAEIIDMPAYVDAPKASKAQLSEEAKRQLRSYVQLIASMYNNNPCKCWPRLPESQML